MRKVMEKLNSELFLLVWQFAKLGCFFNQMLKSKMIIRGTGYCIKAPEHEELREVCGGGQTWNSRRNVVQDWQNTGHIIAGRRFNRNKAFKISMGELWW